MRTTYLALLPFGALAGALFAVGCAPPESSGQCEVDEDCTVRGTVCEPVSNECIATENDYDDSAPNGVPTALLDAKGLDYLPVPFFRGRFCTVPGGEVKAGAEIPFRIEPCLHPCLQPAGVDWSYTYFHQFTCGGSLCSGFTSFYVDVDINSALNCPDEAFAQFPKEQCVYVVGADANLGPITEQGDPLEGLLSQEVPYLTLEDTAEIATFSAGGASEACQASCAGKSELEQCLRGCQVKELAFQYTQDDERVFDFNLANTYPAPPQSCADADSGCECYEVGF